MISLPDSDETNLHLDAIRSVIVNLQDQINDLRVENDRAKEKLSKLENYDYSMWRIGFRQEFACLSRELERMDAIQRVDLIAQMKHMYSHRCTLTTEDIDEMVMYQDELLDLYFEFRAGQPMEYKSRLSNKTIQFKCDYSKIEFLINAYRDAKYKTSKC